MKSSDRHMIDRRSMLRGAGVTLALPWLEAMSPLSRSLASAGEMEADEIPRRAVFTYWGLGMNGRTYTPEKAGLDYDITPTLEPLARHRDGLTVISGLRLTHGGGHTGDRCYLTGTNTYDSDCVYRVSVDQQLSEFMGTTTRYPSLTLGVGRGTGFGASTMDTISWSQSGTPLPSENRPHILFDQLFRSEGREALRQRENAHSRQESVLDAVSIDAERFKRRLGKRDRERIDEYFDSIRDVERAMEAERAWLYKPKPEVAPIDFGDVKTLDPVGQRAEEFDYRRYQRLMYDVITLALQTDSTRVIAYMARRDNSDGTKCFRFMGNPYGLHEMTHHGEDTDKLKWWSQTDRWYMEDWAYFLDKLKSVKEGDGTLLDHTLLAWSSSNGTVNAHNKENLPTMFCGGSRIGMQHRGHLVKDGIRLGSLWQTMSERMGMSVPDEFQGGEVDGPIKEIMA